MVVFAAWFFVVGRSGPHFNEPCLPESGGVRCLGHAWAAFMVGFVKHVFLEQFAFMLQVYLSHVLSWEAVHGRGAWTVQRGISAAWCCSKFFCCLGGCT